MRPELTQKSEIASGHPLHFLGIHKQGDCKYRIPPKRSICVFLGYTECQRSKGSTTAAIRGNCRQGESNRLPCGCSSVGRAARADHSRCNVCAGSNPAIHAKHTCALCIKLSSIRFLLRVLEVDTWLITKIGIGFDSLARNQNSGVAQW